jgi:hypothetical protein
VQYRENPAYFRSTILYTCDMAQWISYPFLVLLLVAVLGSCNRDDDVVITVNVKSTQQISASNGNFDGTLQDDDRFGSAVAAIGDLEGDSVMDLVVGAPGDADGGPGTGAVWILFMDSDGTVDTEEKISASDGNFDGSLHDDDAFGSAVAGLGDMNGDQIRDIAVGAPGDDDGGTDRGAFWILFLNQDGSVQSEAKISADEGNFNGNLDDGDHFGAALAALGDLDGDEITDLAVGAPGDDDDSPDTGAVWILFMNADGTVKNEQKISADSGGLDAQLQSGDAFGSAIANINHLNGDGTIDLAVGAPGDDDGGTDTGAVWILFLAADGRVIDEQKLSSLEGDFEGVLSAGDAFGEALANVGDLDGDSIADLAVGTPGDDDSGTDTGAVWLLFYGEDGKVNNAQKLSSLEGQLDAALASGDRFGSAVAGIGNLDARHGNDLAVGAPFVDDNDTTDSGSLWVLFMDDVDDSTECERNPLLDFLGILDCD